MNKQHAALRISGFLAPSIHQINRLIGDSVFEPFLKVAQKNAKDGALCKMNKERTGNRKVSGSFWSR